MACLLMRRASYLRKLGELKRASQDADRAISSEPHNASLYRIRGNWRCEDGQFEKALTDFDKAISLEPETSIYHFCKGLVLKEQRDYISSMQSLDAAITLEPNNPEYYCSRGRLQTHLGDLEKGLSDLNIAVELDPHNSDYLHWRGRIHRDRQECEEAMADFQAALKITGDDIDFAWRGIMYSQLKQNTKALEDIDRAIELCDTNAFHHQFRGIICFGLERYSDALKSFTRAIELMPQWPGHYVWRAAIHNEARNLKKTIKDLDTALSIHGDEIAFFWRGLAYLDTGQLLKGLYDLEAAFKISRTPVQSRIYFWRAVANMLLGDQQQSDELFEEASRRTLTDKKADKFCEPARIALVKQGDTKLAKKLYTEMLECNFTVDTTRTEQSHLDLLCRLFPHKRAIKSVASWFDRQRKLSHGIEIVE